MLFLLTLPLLKASFNKATGCIERDLKGTVVSLKSSENVIRSLVLYQLPRIHPRFCFSTLIALSFYAEILNQGSYSVDASKASLTTLPVYLCSLFCQFMFTFRKQSSGDKDGWRKSWVYRSWLCWHHRLNMNDKKKKIAHWFLMSFTSGSLARELTLHRGHPLLLTNKFRKGVFCHCLHFIMFTISAALLAAWAVPHVGLTWNGLSQVVP